MKKAETIRSRFKMVTPEYKNYVALERAHGRCRRVARNRALPWFFRERALELLTTGSLVEYETAREAWDDLGVALASRPPRP